MELSRMECHWMIDHAPADVLEELLDDIIQCVAEQDPGNWSQERILAARQEWYRRLETEQTNVVVD